MRPSSIAPCWQCRPHLGLPYHLVTGDVRQANYSSLRAELVEFRRRVQQLQHGVIAHQLCRPIWARWLEMAQLAGRLDLPGLTLWPRAWCNGFRRAGTGSIH
jgi:capsid protein